LNRTAALVASNEKDALKSPDEKAQCIPSHSHDAGVHLIIFMAKSMFLALGWP
jgi:hypothetical protein